jgi:hypothetical protein
MTDADGPDIELQARVEILFRLWNDIRWVFRALPKPEQVGPMNRRWVTYPPTRAIVPKLITHAAMQPISAQQRVGIIHSLTAWSDAFTQLVAIAALARADRSAELYSAATAALHECADEMARAVVSLRRDMNRKRRRHGPRPLP